MIGGKFYFVKEMKHSQQLAETSLVLQGDFSIIVMPTLSFKTITEACN